MSLPTRPLACKRWYHIQRWRNTMVLLLILHLQLRIDTDERLSLVQQVLRICTDNLDENKKVLGQFGQQFLIFRQSLIFSFVAIISPGFSCSLSSWSKVSLGLAFLETEPQCAAAPKPTSHCDYELLGLHRVGFGSDHNCGIPCHWYYQ